ncbi:MAG: YtxH domain-containing protein [Ruminococcus flavefaciens]|nr:YtxH domain-containing protein [Ruminococcus flavefaciens]MCM1058701.1 YtxH domain-containing protein [Eubacterium sp.]
MNKLLVAALVAGAAATVGYVVSKVRNGNNVDSDYDDDIYNDYDVDGDESIDFEINDNTAQAEDTAEEAEAETEAEEAVVETEEAAEEADEENKD